MQNKKKPPHKPAVICATLYAKAYRKYLKDKGLKGLYDQDKLGFWSIQSEYNKGVCRSLLNIVNKAPEEPKQEYITAKIGLGKPRTV